MNITGKYEGFCTNVIIDGEIIDHHLQIINRDKNWLQGELNQQNIKSCSEVLLGYIDSSDNLVIHLKNFASTIVTT